MKKISLLFLIICTIASCGKEELPKDGIYTTDHTENWMQDILAKYPNAQITLQDLCLPRAHDAGQYVMNNCLAGNTCNTKTQYLSMQDMLLSGIRVFDVRPTLVDGEIWTFHRTVCGGLGCEGVDLRTMLEETKTYLDTHNELVIFELDHFCNTGVTDHALMGLLTLTLGDRIYTVEDLNVNALVEKDLRELLPENQQGGKIVLVFQGLNASSTTVGDVPFPESYLPREGTYANNENIDLVIADQLQKFTNFDPSTNALFKFCYTFTLSTGSSVACVSNEDSAVSIESIALEARDGLGDFVSQQIVNGTFNKNKIPNFFSVDFANTTVTEACIQLSELSIEQ